MALKYGDTPSTTKGGKKPGDTAKLTSKNNSFRNRKNVLRGEPVGK